MPTRTTATSKTIIDIIATTHPDRIEGSIVEANSLSDHYLTGVIRKLHCMKFKPRMIVCRDYSKFNISWAGCIKLLFTFLITVL